jgi:hypothetical protein
MIDSIAGMPTRCPRPPALSASREGRRSDEPAPARGTAGPRAADRARSPSERAPRSRICCPPALPCGRYRGWPAPAGSPRPVLAAAGNRRGRAVTPGGLSARLSGTLGLPALALGTPPASGDEPVVGPGAVRAGRQFPVRAGVDGQAGDGSRGPGGARARPPGSARPGSGRHCAASIILVGGGDPTLAAGAPPASDYPQPATLESLAAQTARRCARRAGTQVQPGLRHLAVHRPAAGPGWPASYVTTETSARSRRSRPTRAG